MIDRGFGFRAAPPDARKSSTTSAGGDPHPSADPRVKAGGLGYHPLLTLIATRIPQMKTGYRTAILVAMLVLFGGLLTLLSFVALSRTR